MGSSSTDGPGSQRGIGKAGTGELPPSTPRGLNDTYSPGKKIGDKYTLVRPLGQGGMATVWVAHNEALDIHVAIKFVRTELKQQVEGLDSRLLQEARAAARLGHPAIVRISDFGKTTRGDPYIVMELLAGEDLAQALARRGALEPLRAVRTLLPIADALAAAHEQRIVHRDLKPDNVFLAETPEGRTQPKLVDFGIAKLEHDDESKRITEAGRAMGSPAYMSPEQARGHDADARTDIWSMCVMLYEVLTKKLPFDGESYPSLVAAILEREPKSILEHGVLEPALWEIIRRGLRKQPEKRWHDMRTLGAALASWAIEQGADDDISGRSLMCTWIERPPDSLRAGARTSVTAITELTELPDYDPESIRKPLVRLETPPEDRPLLASGAQLAVSMETERSLPKKWIVALAIGLPALVLGLVFPIAHSAGPSVTTGPSAAAVQPGPAANTLPAAPPVARPPPSATAPPVPSSDSPGRAAQAPRPRSGAGPRPSASVSGSASPAASATSKPAPPAKSASWDTDSPLPPQ